MQDRTAAHTGREGISHAGGHWGGQSLLHTGCTQEQLCSLHISTHGLHAESKLLMSACTSVRISCPLLAQGPIAQQRRCWSCRMLYQMHVHSAPDFAETPSMMSSPLPPPVLGWICYAITLLLTEQCHTCATRMDAHVPALSLPPQREGAQGALLWAAALGFTSQYGHAGRSTSHSELLQLSESFCQTFG